MFDYTWFTIFESISIDCPFGGQSNKIYSPVNISNVILLYSEHVCHMLRKNTFIWTFWIIQLWCQHGLSKNQRPIHYTPVFNPLCLDRGREINGGIMGYCTRAAKFSCAYDDGIFEKRKETEGSDYLSKLLKQNQMRSRMSSQILKKDAWATWSADRWAVSLQKQVGIWTIICTLETDTRC